MKTKFPLLFIILSICCINIKAQGFDSSKLIFGGDIGFAISNSSWRVGISPQIGYKLTDKFHTGAGISYIHGESKGSDIYKYNENSIGLNLFAHYYPWKKIVLRLKPEIMYTWYKEKYVPLFSESSEMEEYTTNKFVPAVVVGGGVHLRPVMILLNYELVQNKYSSYSDNVFLSIGFMF
jgi:hypothetical protein